MASFIAGVVTGALMLIFGALIFVNVASKEIDDCFEDWSDHL